MIAAERDYNKSNVRFVIQPNCSISWTGTRICFAGISLVAFVIAAMFAFKGAWLILPFAGLEIVALGIGLYLTACKNKEREIVSILDDVVRIERGRYYPRQVHELTRAWTRVELQETRQSWYPSRLTMRCGGQIVEVGAKLNEEERVQLAREIRSGLQPKEFLQGFAL